MDQNYGDLLAGPELDDEVAKRVMGWHLDGAHEHWLTPDGKASGFKKPGKHCKECAWWVPSTEESLFCGWKVVERMAVLGFAQVFITQVGDAPDWSWSVKFFSQTEYAKTVQLAICLAALAEVDAAEADRIVARELGR